MVSRGLHYPKVFAVLLRHGVRRQPQPRGLKRYRNLPVWVGRKAVGLPKGGGKAQADREKQSWSEPSPTAAFTEFHSPWEFRFLHFQIVVDPYVLLFFFFSCASFTAGYFCCPRGVEGRPSCCFSPPSRSPTEPWLRQLDLHSGGSPCHPVKRLGIRVCACNLLHNTEICVFLYNLYPLLYLGYLNSRIEYFSHTRTHTNMCVFVSTQ